MVNLNLEPKAKIPQPVQVSYSQHFKGKIYIQRQKGALILFCPLFLSVTRMFKITYFDFFDSKQLQSNEVLEYMLRINWSRFGLEDCRIKLHPENLPIGKSSCI